jgi:hypothetical protein
MIDPIPQRPTGTVSVTEGDGAATPGNPGVLPESVVADQMANGQAAPIFREYEPNLFDLYTRFRYNELVCRRLTRKAIKLEKWVRWSVVISLAISLFTGVIPGMNQGTLNWIWASLTTFATLLTVYALIEGSGGKQFRWFQLAMRFHSSANAVEFFSVQVRRGKVNEDELAEAWGRFTRELDSLIDGAGLDFLEYEAKHKAELTEDLAATLRHENRAS